MPVETLNEIFELCKRVLHETRHFIHFDLMPFKQGEEYVCVSIKEGGWDPDKPSDATYSFICNCREGNICYGIYRLDYENCKAHLERLLKDGVVSV